MLKTSLLCLFAATAVFAQQSGTNSNVDKNIPPAPFKGGIQQSEFRYNINPFPVRDAAGVASAQPFLGGFNQPHPQFADVDGDGDLDLFVQEVLNEIIFFENTDSKSAPQFEWRSSDFENLHVGVWFKMADLDNDNDPDIYSDSPGSLIRIYRNTGTGFVLAADSLRDDAGNLIVTEVPSIPEMADIDCDGDPDLFLTTGNGQVVFYRNTGQNASNLPIFTFVTDKFEDIAFTEGAKRSQPPAHGASTIALVDIDNDGDSDLFWGEFFSRSLRFLENSGDCSDPQIALTSDSYPPRDTLLTGGYNVPQFVDIDDNGTLDLFVGAQGGAFNLPIDAMVNFYFYRNNGTPEQPDFSLQSRRFGDMPDVGKNSLVSVADIDADGETLGEGRDLTQIRKTLGAAAAATFSAVDDPRWNRDGIVQWDFGELPKRIDIQRGGVALKGYPALIDTGEAASLRLLDCPLKATFETRSGLRRLFSLAERRELKAQADWLPNIDRILLNAATLPDAANFRQQIAELIADRAFLSTGNIPRSAEEFDQQRQPADGPCRPGSRRAVGTHASQLSKSTRRRRIGRRQGLGRRRRRHAPAITGID